MTAPPVFATVGVVGAGAWGTALALVAARAGRRTVLWGRDADRMRTIAASRQNARYLPGVTLPAEIDVTAEPAALAGTDLLLLATPAQHLRSVLGQVPPGPAWMAIAAKGLELPAGLLMTEVAAQARPQAGLAVLSGPSFAAEVAAGLPTALTIACADADVGAALCQALGSASFRPYWTQDLVGVQLGGALKNVLAIAAGVAMGLELGENARAALIARGLAELRRLGRALGAEPETLTGLSGLGDLVLTATSLTSRNTALGHALGRGEALAAVLARRHVVTEGVATAGAALALGRRLGVELPVTAVVQDLLDGRLAPQQAIGRLMARPWRAEHG